MTENKRPNVEENYTGAVASSNLRMDVREGTGTGAAGLLIAAGWSKSRLGALLMRLHSEWDGSAKPSRPTDAAIEALASTYPRKQKGTRKVKSYVIFDGRQVAVEQTVPHMVLDIASAHAEAFRWYEAELRTLVGRLKTLVDARREVTLQAMKWRIQDPEETAGAVLKYWLDQTCHACDGLKFRPVAGAPALSNRICAACGGSGISPVPCGQEGRRLVNYVDDCVQRARKSIQSSLSMRVTTRPEATENDK